VTTTPAQPTGDSAPRPNWFARHDLALFFVLAFVLSWLAWPAVLSNPDSSPLVPFGPALAAITVTALAGGAKQVLYLLRQLGRWRVHPGWYAIAVGLPFALTGLAVILAVVAGAPAPDAETYEGWYQLPVSLLITLLIVGCFEELGWRGFALPRLQRSRTALTSALLIGVLWAIWHLPELVSDPTDQRPPLPFFVWVIALSVILAWLYNSTSGSVLIVALSHSAANTAGAFLLPGFDGDRYLLVMWLMAAAYAAAAVSIVLLAGADQLTTRLTDRRASAGGDGPLQRQQR
jgi:hypothetical protein